MATRYFKALNDGYIVVGEYEVTAQTYIGGGSPQQGNEMRTYGTAQPLPKEWTKGVYNLDIPGFNEGSYLSGIRVNTKTVSVPRVKRVQFLNFYLNTGSNTSITLVAVDFAKYDAGLQAKTAKVYLDDASFLVDFPADGFGARQIPKPFTKMDINLNACIQGDFLDEAGAAVNDVLIYFGGTASFAQKYSVIESIYLENDTLLDPDGSASDVVTANGYAGQYGRLMRFYGTPVGSKSVEGINQTITNPATGYGKAIDKGLNFDAAGNPVFTPNYSTRDGITTLTQAAYNVTKPILR
jgi:hypothetical protein